MSEFEPNTAEFRESEATVEVRSCLKAVLDVVQDDEVDSQIKELASAELDRSIIGETQLGSKTWVRLSCGVSACGAACTITDAYAGDDARVTSLLAPGRERSLDDCIQEWTVPLNKLS